MSAQLQHDDFAQCLTDKFQVMDENAAPFDLELIQVSEEMVAPRQRVFSILFRGPLDKFMPQRIYKLKHHQLGVREIFLVPVSKDNEGYQYQAVFNYLIQSAS